MILEIGSLINGKEIAGGGRLKHKVRNPYHNELVGMVHFGTVEDLNQAIETAHGVFHQTMKNMPAYQRSTILRQAADLLEARGEEFAQLLTLEAGKPIRDSRFEVDRAVQVLRFASELAKADDGEVV